MRRSSFSRGSITVSGVKTLQTFESSFIDSQRLSYLRKRGSNVRHIQHQPCTGLIWSAKQGNGTTSYVKCENYILFPYYDSFLSTRVNALVGDFYRTFDHSKLPTSSEFNTLAFFAELDETLLIFTKKFWKSLTYGSFTWGVLPFVSELKSLLSTISKYSKQTNPPILREGRARDKTFTHYANISGSTAWDCKISVKNHKYGSLIYGDLSDADLWLDKLGIYADLNTAWDLVPLSFVVDWLLPVGDFLSSIHPSGNIRSIGFAGWISSKVTCELSLTGVSSDLGSAPTFGAGVKTGFSYYDRVYSNELLVIGSKKQPEFELPSLKQMFDMLYIFAIGGKKAFGRKL